MAQSKFIKIGAYLRHYREQINMNQNDFAKLCDINPVQYRRYENNASFPRQEQLDKIFDTLRGLNVKNQVNEPITSENFMSYAFRDTMSPLPIRELIRNDLLKIQGYELIIDKDNKFIGIEGHGKLYEISNEDLNSLEKSTEDFFKFKLNEILEKSRIVHETFRDDR